MKNYSNDISTKTTRDKDKFETTLIVDTINTEVDEIHSDEN